MGFLGYTAFGCWLDVTRSLQLVSDTHRLPSHCGSRRTSRLLAYMLVVGLPILLLSSLFATFLIGADLFDSSAPSLDISAAVSELHQRYRVPISLATAIPYPDEVIRALRNGPSPNDVTQVFDQTKLFVLHLCDDRRARRLQTISSALAYARHTKRVLVVLWDTIGGTNVLLAAPRPKTTTTRRDIVIHRVHDLVLERQEYDWAELDLARFDAMDEPLSSIASFLDNVVGLKSKHLYMRTNGWISSRYATYASGLADFVDCLTVYEDEDELHGEGFTNNNNNNLDDVVSSMFNPVSGLPFENENLSDISSVQGARAQYDRIIMHSNRLPSPDSWRSAITSRFGVFSRNVYAGAEARLQLAFQTVFRDRTFPHLNSSQIVELLNRDFLVPNVFLSSMTERTRRQLLHDVRQSRSKRVIFLHTQFGLGNRLRALGSAMAVAHAAGRVLVVIWVPDVHLNCTFDDLFVNDDLIVMDNLDLPWPPQRIKPVDDALSAVDFWNMMRNDQGPVHDPLVVNVDPRENRHLYVKSAYVVRSKLTPKILKTNSPYWVRMRETLVPTVDVMELVQDPNLSNIETMIGVHIRARTLETDIAGVTKQFYGSGSVTTDLWRRRTSFTTFARKIRILSSKYRYFVAADMPESITALQQEFGVNRIFSLRRTDVCESRTAECVRLALADIILLSRVRTLLGSHWSSFTEAAVRLNKRVPSVHLAGIHFGRAPHGSN